MKVNLHQIADDLLKLPAASRVDLAERLLESVDGFTAPEVEKAWREEVSKRVRQFESGAVQGIPAGEVHAYVRDRLNDARGLSP